MTKKKSTKASSRSRRVSHFLAVIATQDEVKDLVDRVALAEQMVDTEADLVDAYGEVGAHLFVAMLALGMAPKAKKGK